MKTTRVSSFLLLLALAAQSCSHPQEASAPTVVAPAQTTATSFSPPSFSASPSPEPPTWLSAFLTSQTEEATTPTPPSRDTLFPVERQVTAVIERTEQRDRFLPGSFLLRASWARDHFYLLDLSSGLASRLPGRNLLIPELAPQLAARLISPDSQALAYTECVQGGITRLHVVNALAEEVPTAPLPEGASWVVSSWLDEHRIQAIEADIPSDCLCASDVSLAEAQLAILNLQTRESLTLHPPIPLSNQDGVVHPSDPCIPAPALQLSPSENLVALQRQYPSTTAPPRPPATFLEVWQIDTGRMVQQIKTSGVYDQPAWLGDGESLLVGFTPYVPQFDFRGDCEARTWIIQDQHSSYPIAECTVGVSISPSGRLAATFLSYEESGCPAGIYRGRRVAILDLTARSAQTFLVCDPHSGSYIGDPLWSPDEEYLAFNQYSEANPFLTTPEIIILHLADGSASAFPVDAGLLGWMQSAMSQ